jgi:peptide/nickel transport system permease protein
VTTAPIPPNLPPVPAQDPLMGADELVRQPPAAALDAAAATIKGRSQWEIFWRRFRRHRLGIIGVVVLALIALAAILVPYISPYTFNAVDITHIQQGPSWSHPFGTAELGQDELTRVLLAGRVSLQVGFLTAIFAGVLGTVLGLVAGYFGGWSDSAISRTTDLFLAAPVFIVLIAVSIVIGNPGLLAIVLILATFTWMPLTRIVRASALSLKEREFVQAARAMGASRSRILVRHVLPNAVAEIIVFTTLTVGLAILTETALSFLGLGINSATQVSWGNMLSDQQANVLGGDAWWLTVFPGAFILVTVLCVNFIGDALRDALDPYGMSLVSKE